MFGTHSSLDASGSAPTGRWSFVVEPTRRQSARLLTRSSGGATRTWLGQAFTRTLFEPLHFAMERRMLEGVKGLAEGHPISRTSDVLQLLTWAATFMQFLASGALVLLGWRPRRRLLGFAAAGLAFQIVTLGQAAPLVSLALVIALALIIWPLPRKPASRAPDLLEQAS